MPSVVHPKSKNNNSYRNNNNSGDWRCGNCNYSNSSYITYCGQCNEPKPNDYRGGSRGGGGYSSNKLTDNYSRMKMTCRGGGGYRGGYRGGSGGNVYRRGGGYRRFNNYGGYRRFNNYIADSNNYIADSNDNLNQISDSGSNSPSLDNSIIDHKIDNTDAKNIEDLLLKNAKDLSDIKITMNKILEQITRTKIMEQITRTKIMEQRKQITELKKIEQLTDTKTNNNKYKIIIDGYLRECFKQSQSHFNTQLQQLVTYFYPQMTDNELIAALKDKPNGKTTSKKQNILNDIELFNILKQTKEKHHLDVENECVYLMIQNFGIDIRNKQYCHIKKHILSFLIDIGVELDDLFVNDKNEFELKYDEKKANLYVQLKMNSENAVKSAISKADKYVLYARKEQKNIEMKWKVKQWCNYKNRGKISSKQHKRKALKNKKICNNKSQNRTTNISGALPNQMSTNIVPLNNCNYSLPIIPGINYQSSAYRFPLPNNIQPIYYNNPNNQ